MAQVNNKRESSWGEIVYDIISYIIMIPFIPIVLGLIWLFGWVIGKGKEVSEEE